MNTLISFMHDHAWHQPVYFFSTRVRYEFPAIDYAEVYPGSRYSSLVWLPALLKYNKNKQLVKEKDFFINSVADELNSNKPVLVLIDVQKNKPYLKNISFDYLNEFLKNEKFKIAWKNYHYLTTLDEGSNYKFKVYQLMRSSSVADKLRLK